MKQIFVQLLKFEVTLILSRTVEGTSSDVIGMSTAVCI
jgi:hypothetical protein